MTETTYILVKIDHKGPLRKTVARDLPGRLSQVAYDLVQARGADCLDATAKHSHHFARMVAEDSAKACQDRIMGDNNREDAEARRCAEAILELYK